MGPNNGRKANNSNGKKSAPKEVQQYYNSEHRERVGLAWLIAFVSLIVTVAVVLGLFFGGRWVYRKVAHKSNTTTTATKTQSGSSKPNQPAPSETNSSNSSSNSTNASGSGQSPATGSSTGSSSAGSSAVQTPNSNLTNTGPGQTLATFIGVTVVGTMTYEIYLRRRAAKA